MDYRLGDLQLSIMKVLWRAGPVSVADVHAELAERRLAYTTVATMLRKMEDRGLVAHREDKEDARGRFLYRPLVSEQQVASSMTNELFEQVFDGNLTSAVSQLLQAREVSRDELADLERLIPQPSPEGFIMTAMSDITAMAEVLHTVATADFSLLMLVIGPAIIVLGAWLAARSIVSGIVHRTLWQTAGTGVALLVLFNVTGTSSWVADAIRQVVSNNLTAPSVADDIGVIVEMNAHEIEDQHSTGASSTVESYGAIEISRSGDSPITYETEQVTSVVAASPNPQPPIPNPRPLAPATSSSLATLLVLVWLGVTLLLVTKQVFTWQRVRQFVRRCSAIRDDDLASRAKSLAEQLGLRRSVCILTYQKLATPIALGWRRPTLILPVLFSEQYSRTAQDAILAHELAHLAANDPSWQRGLGLLAAGLWWHPAVWIVRREWHQASEMAADEASSLVSDGPRQLAEALVELGGRLTGRHPVAALAAVGRFRSALGRRVERLIELQANPRPMPSRLKIVIGHLTVTLVLIGAMILFPAWARPEQPFAQGDQAMKGWNQYWWQSMLGLALVSFAPPAQADDENQPSRDEIRNVEVEVELELTGDRVAQRDGDRERPRDGDRPRAENRDPDPRREGERGEGERRERGPAGAPRVENERERDVVHEKLEAEMRATRDKWAAELKRRETAMAELKALLSNLKDGQDDKASAIKQKLAATMAETEKMRQSVEEHMQNLKRRMNADARESRPAAGLPDGGKGDKNAARMKHLHAAAEHLRAAGMVDLAEKLMAEARGGERERGRDERVVTIRRIENEARGGGEMASAVKEMNQALQSMRREMAELREQVNRLRGEKGEGGRGGEGRDAPRLK